MTPNFDDDSTDVGANAPQAFAEWVSEADDCPAGDLEVFTGVRSVSTVGSGDNDVRTVTNTGIEEGFFFVVP